MILIFLSFAITMKFMSIDNIEAYITSHLGIKGDDMFIAASYINIPVFYALSWIIYSVISDSLDESYEKVPKRTLFYTRVLTLSWMLCVIGSGVGVIVGAIISENWKEDIVRIIMSAAPSFIISAISPLVIHCISEYVRRRKGRKH